MTFSELNKPTETTDEVSNSSASSSLNTSYILKVLQYLLLATFICICLLTFILPEDKLLFIGAAVALSLFLFIFLTDRQLFQESVKKATQNEFEQKAQLYACLFSANNATENRSIDIARAKALKYCQELIDDYKKTRGTSRNIYYTFQLATVVLSGITPILVLVDKLEAGQAWLKWLPVICPAIASIVASIVTSFPFQENWISANTTVESLEAEQEKFVLGLTPAYRCYDIADPVQRQQMSKMAIENFINQVNSIHLNQVEQQIAQKRPTEADKKPTGSGQSSPNQPK